MRDQPLHACPQERDELSPCHLTRGTGEFPMLDCAKPRDMTGNRHIVRRIGEDHFGLLAIHQGGEYLAVPRIAANQTMPAQLPDVARTATGLTLVHRRQLVRLRVALFFHRAELNQRIHLGNGEPGKLDLERWI